MIETSEKTAELKTVSITKDTWILEIPPEVCRSESFAEGTIISLTPKTIRFRASTSNRLEKLMISSIA